MEYAGSVRDAGISMPKGMQLSLEELLLLTTEATASLRADDDDFSSAAWECRSAAMVSRANTEAVESERCSSDRNTSVRPSSCSETSSTIKRVPGTKIKSEEEVEVCAEYRWTSTADDVLIVKRQRGRVSPRSSGQSTALREDVEATDHHKTHWPLTKL